MSLENETSFEESWKDNLAKHADPLDVVYKYIYSLRQKAEKDDTLDQAGLIDALQIGTQYFKQPDLLQRYNQDPRLVRLWLWFGEYLDDPVDGFLYMESRGIGLQLALYYEEYAKFTLRRRGQPDNKDILKAIEILEHGIKKHAYPVESLEKFHSILLKKQQRKPAVACSLENNANSSNRNEMKLNPNKPSKLKSGTGKAQNSKKKNERSAYDRLMLRNDQGNYISFEECRAAFWYRDQESKEKESSFGSNSPISRNMQHSSVFNSPIDPPEAENLLDELPCVSAPVRNALTDIMGLFHDGNVCDSDENSDGSGKLFDFNDDDDDDEKNIQGAASTSGTKVRGVSQEHGLACDLSSRNALVEDEDEDTFGKSVAATSGNYASKRLSKIASMTAGSSQSRDITAVSGFGAGFSENASQNTVTLEKFDDNDDDDEVERTCTIITQVPVQKLLFNQPELEVFEDDGLTGGLTTGLTGGLTTEQLAGLQQFHANSVKYPDQNLASMSLGPKQVGGAGPQATGTGDSCSTNRETRKPLAPKSSS